MCFKIMSCYAMFLLLIFINKKMRKYINRFRLFKKKILIFVTFLIIFATFWLKPDNDIEEKRKLSSKTGSRYPVWIVVYQTHVTPQQLRKLKPCQICKILVVENKRDTHFRFNYTENIEWLNLGRSSDLSHRIFRHVNRNAEVRKMLGFLYAIQNGAEHIYDWNGEDHAFLTSAALADFDLEKTFTSALVYDDVSAPIVNPFHHFAGSKVISAEFRSIPANSSYFLRVLLRPVIQHRLTDPHLDSQSPPLFLPRGALIPLSWSNTLHSFPAFWTLFIPSTLSTGSWLWRGFLVQKLLWMTDHTVSILPPMTSSNSLPVENKNTEMESSWKVGINLVKFLQKWTCEIHLAFFDCVNKLTEEMISRGYFRSEDQLLIRDWLNDLRDIGYEEPRRIESKANNSLPKQKSSWVYYKNTGHQRLSSDIFNGFLLVIVFPGDFNREFTALKNFYRKNFDKILFCATVSGYRKLKSVLGSESDISLVNVSRSGDWRNHECLSRAMEMRYSVKGYVVMGSERSLNPERLTSSDFTRSRIFYAAEFGGENFLSSNDTVRLVFNGVSSDQGNEQKGIVKNFWERCFTPNSSCVTFARFEALFISKEDSQMLLLLLKIFFKSNLSWGVAVPIALAGLKLIANF